MAMRVNRVAGWALTGVHLDKHGDIDDPRINRDSTLLRPTPEPGLLDTFGRWLIERYADDDFMRRLALDKLAGLAQNAPREAVIVHGDGEASTAVLLVRPVHMTSWHRLDDDLDYMDASARGHNGSSILQELDFCPFPYDGQRMDALTGRELSSRDVHVFRVLQSASDLAEQRAEFGLQFFGTSDWTEVCERVVPNVPTDVRDLLDWSGLLVSPRVLGALRPVLFTFWA